MARKKRKKRIAGLLFAIALVVGMVVLWRYYSKVFTPNVILDEKEQFVFIETGSTLNQVTENLYQKGVLQDTVSFLWLARKKNYQNNIYPGKYKIENKMNNNELINLLRSGKQTPVQVSFHSIRTKEALANSISGQLELDSAELLKMLKSEEAARKYGFNKETFLTMFLPNTYEFYWNTSAPEFIQRMAEEYKRFWNPGRIAKANKLGLSQSEVSILASIVQAEQMSHPEERPMIAGLYLNRLRIGMPLQSDPTIIHALGDYSIKRVLNKDKKINSKYNTYIYKGLPPGPINLPEISSIEAVLNPRDHDYLYMCAKADFSGYHHFSTNLRQHNIYAAQYRRELNRRDILR